LDAVSSHMARVMAVENKKSLKVTSEGNCKNIVLCGDFNSPDIDLLNLLSTTTKQAHNIQDKKRTIVDNSTIIGLTTNQPGKIFCLI